MSNCKTFFLPTNNERNHLNPDLTHQMDITALPLHMLIYKLFYKTIFMRFSN
jgi:hypothetical protein